MKLQVWRIIDLELFSKHDYIGAERYWSSEYIQHNAHIPPGRKGFFNLVKSTPTLEYEPGTMAVEGYFVMVRGRPHVPICLNCLHKLTKEGK